MNSPLKELQKSAQKQLVIGRKGIFLRELVWGGGGRGCKRSKLLNPRDDFSVMAYTPLAAHKADIL